MPLGRKSVETLICKANKIPVQSVRNIVFPRSILVLKWWITFLYFLSSWRLMHICSLATAQTKSERFVFLNIKNLDNNCVFNIVNPCFDFECFRTVRPAEGEFFLESEMRMRSVSFHFLIAPAIPSSKALQSTSIMCLEAVSTYNSVNMRGLILTLILFEICTKEKYFCVTNV